MKIKKKSSNGFTLVELFLVVVVLVILAGTIMVSGENSVISAEANNIITNMQILKSAALEWLADYSDYVDQIGNHNYMITYPFSNLRSHFQSDAERSIQNLMREKGEKDHGRDTMMKYIKTASSISVNKATKDPRAEKDGYSFVDGSGAYNNVSNTWTKTYNKWYVVYQFNDKSTHVTKLKKKIAEKAEEFGLLKNATEYYTIDADYVYMEIIDLKVKDSSKN